MAKLSDIAVDDLHDALDDVSTGKAAKRLMIALAYKDGVLVETLSTRYAIPRSTVYYWLDRFEEMPIDEAIQDEDRPGRPPALTNSEREQLQSDIEKPPRSFGYDTGLWTIEVLQEHITNKYNVSYSDGHIRRLLRSFDTESTYL
ncbi:helix-turn-helix domain-containing protein [Halomicrococcus sp. NG-SE-24]|uniref:helix-turn-helix domain-containing protein n=1 Tax=Halomicrococcus sp. NG-SE-24 TaxID=3436928 RepID=UPI003D999EAC